MTRTALAAPRSPDRLRRDAVSLPGVIAHAISVIAPSLSGAFITYLAAQKAGGATPVAFLLATAACVLIGLIVCQFADRLPSAGSLYTYTVHGLGPGAGIVVGCCYVIGFAFGCPALLAGFGVFTASVAADRGATGLFAQWWFWFAVGLGGLWALSWFNVRFSTRAQLLLTAATTSTLALLALIVIGRGGAHGNTLDAFSAGAADVSDRQVLGGMAFGMLSFVGFESAAALAEETRDPRRDVTRAVLGTVLVAGGFFLLLTYATSIGYGVREATTAWPASGGGLAALAARYAPWLKDWVLLAGGICALLAGIGAHNTVARTLYAMGRERVLPSALGRTHRTWSTPHVAIGVNLAVTVTVAAGLIAATSRYDRDLVGGSPGRLSAGFYLLAEGLTMVAPLALLCYALLCIAALRLAVAESSPRRILLALAGMGAAGAGTVGSLYYCFVEAAPGSGIPAPYRAVPVVVGLTLAGAVTAATVLRTRPVGLVFE